MFLIVINKIQMEMEKVGIITEVTHMMNLVPGKPHLCLEVINFARIWVVLFSVSSLGWIQNSEILIICTKLAKTCIYTS